MSEPVNQGNQAELAAASARALKIKWAIVGGMLLLGVLIIFALPRGYKDDLSMIGKGRPVVVIVHDKNSMNSLDLMHVTDGLRGEYAGKVEFLVADVSSDAGSRFAAENMPPPALIFYDAAGNKLKVLGKVDAFALRAELNSIFALGQP